MSELVEAAQGLTAQAGDLARQAHVLVILAGLNCIVTAVLLGAVMAHSLAR